MVTGSQRVISRTKYLNLLGTCKRRNGMMEYRNDGIKWTLFFYTSIIHFKTSLDTFPRRSDAVEQLSLNQNVNRWGFYFLHYDAITLN